MVEREYVPLRDFLATRFVAPASGAAPRIFASVPSSSAPISRDIGHQATVISPLTMAPDRSGYSSNISRKAASVRRSVAPGTAPRRRTSRCLSSDRIWSSNISPPLPRNRSGMR